MLRIGTAFVNNEENIFNSPLRNDNYSVYELIPRLDAEELNNN